MKNQGSKHRPAGIALPLLPMFGVIAILAMLSSRVGAQSSDGLWQSGGYGLLVEIDGAKMTTFQITSISCMPWWTAQRSNGAGNR